MVRTLVRVAFPLVVALLLSVPAVAATLRGRVVDPDGRAVAGATVLAVTDGQPLRSVTTNARGEFTLEVADGAVEIRAAMPGFRAEPLVRTASGDTDLGEIRLAVGAVSEAVVVSASQVEIPLSEASSSVTVIDRAELQAKQAHSVADALRAVPGLTVVAAGGPGAVTGIFPRGGESNFTLVFIDDVPVNAFGGEYDFGALSTENVERIEIVRGPQSALFGSNAIGGVVRIVTRRGGPSTLGATIEGGTYDTMRTAASSSGAIGRFEWGASAERLASEGRNGETTATGLMVANDDYDRASGAFSAGWRASGATLRGFVRHAVDDRGSPGPFGSNPIGAYDGIDTIARTNNAQTTASLSASVPLSPKVRSLFQTGYHRLESDFASDFGPSESSSRRWTGRAQFDVALATPLALTAGAEVQRERAGSTFITGTGIDPVPVERTIGGYFTELRYTHARRLMVSGGVRIDDIRRDPLGDASVDEEDHVVSVNPRLSVAWIARQDPGSRTKLRASAATGIRPPGAFDIAFTNNPSLKPERSVSGEAAIEQAFAGGQARVELAAFFNEYDDLIVAVGNFQQSSRYTTDNIANARARGIEASVDAGHRFFATRPLDVHARVAYTFLDTEVLAVDLDDEAPPPFSVGQPLLRRPRHQVSAEVTARTGRLTAFVAGRARGRALDVEPSLGTFGGLHFADGFAVYDLGASYRVPRLGEVFARIENLFDRTYEEALGFPAPGRRATVGLRIAAGR